MTTASVSLHKSCTSSDVCATLYPHITDLINLSTFLIQGSVQAFCTLHTHTPDVSETFTDHMQAHANTDIHKGVYLYPRRHTHRTTSHAADTHHRDFQSPPPNWIVCSDNPQDSRSIDVRGRPMKIQGPWGAEGVMHIFTAWLASSSTTNEHIPVSVYSFFFFENAIII